MRRLALQLAVLIVFFGIAEARPYLVRPGQAVTISHVHQFVTAEHDTNLRSVLPRILESQKTTPEVSTVRSIVNDSTSWISFFVVGDSSLSEQVLRFDVTYSIYIDVWSITQGKVEGPRRAGFGYGRDTRDLNTTIPALRLPAAGSDTALIVIRMSGGAAKVMSRPPMIESRDAFEVQARQALYVNGMFFGLVFALLIYNFFLYISTRERAYLIYVCNTAVTFAWMFAFESLPNVLFPESVGRHTISIMYVCGSIANALGTLFVMSLLQTREIMPRFHRALITQVSISLIYAAILVYSTRPPISFLSNVFGLTQAVLVSIAGVIAFRHKLRAARYFLLAFSVLLLSLFYWSVSNLGIIPRVIDGFDALRMGTAIELIVLSFALADRLNSMRKDKEDAERKALQAEVLSLRNVELEEANNRSNRLLLNVLPEAIAERMKAGEQHIAEAYENVAVVFADISQFTVWSSNLSAAQTVSYLDMIFSKMDELTERHGLEKIKTIGDCYMVVCGVPDQNADSCEAAARYALELRDLVASFDPIPMTDNEPLQMRIGMDFGHVVAGVIGKKKFAFDLWGDVVNTAARMESHGRPGEILCTSRVESELRGRFVFDEQPLTDIKGKGMITTYILRSELHVSLHS